MIRDRRILYSTRDLTAYDMSAPATHNVDIVRILSFQDDDKAWRFVRGALFAMNIQVCLQLIDSRVDVQTT